MTGPLRLNMHGAQKWAAVVSGTVWKTWGLSPAGTLEAEALRGPLIIWAKPTPGEGGEAVKLEAPKPSPLEVRVMTLNTAAHFERFRRAAGGKRRLMRVTRKSFSGSPSRRKLASVIKALTFGDLEQVIKQFKMLKAVQVPENNNYTHKLHLV